MALKKWPKSLIALMVLGGLAFIFVLLFVFLALLFPSRFPFQPTFGNNVATLAFLLTALGTLVLALATFHMARSTREMVQESAYERGQAHVTEFIALVIDPLIERVQEVLHEINKRSFSWSEYPLEQGADRVLKPEDLDRFKVENQIVNKEVAVTKYFIPYANIEIFGEQVHLSIAGFEFRRKHELEEKYKDLNQKILAYDEQMGPFRYMLGDIAVSIHSLLMELESFCSLEKNVQPYVIGISFPQMAWLPDDFERFLPNYSKNKESVSARDYYMANRSLIQDTLFPRLNKARERLDSMCDNLQKRLGSIASMLEDIRVDLCEQYLISETAVRQIREMHRSKGVWAY